MGRAKIVEYVNGRYKGSLREPVCNILETLRNTECVSDLTHIIYCLDDGDVLNIIQSMENYGMMPLGLEKPLGTLEPYQTVGVSYMFWAGSMILGDSVGMGKTVQVAGFFRYMQMMYEKENKPFRYLFLTDKNLVEQSRRDLIKFTGEYVEVLYGEAPKCRRYAKNHEGGTDYSLVGVHSLCTQSIFIEWLMSCDTFPFDVIVIDESSILGSPTSGITKSAKELLKLFNRRIFLNATPFESKLDIFITQLSLLDDKLLPSKSSLQKEYFVMRYNGMYSVHSGKYKNAEQFKDLVGYRYLARTRKSKGAKIVNCSGRMIVSELSKAQKRLMGQVSLWRMVCDCPSYFNLSFDENQVEFNEENVSKLVSLRELLEGELSGVDSILLYCPYLESQYKLEEWLNGMGYSTGLLNGEVKKQQERLEVIRRFKNKEIRVLITNVQKGLNFGSCNYCIFYSFDPNPQKMVQMEGRITREFDIIDKHIYLLCTEGKERQFIEEKLKVRADSSSKFTELDESCIMSLLLEN